MDLGEGVEVEVRIGADAIEQSWYVPALLVGEGVDEFAPRGFRIAVVQGEGWAYSTVPELISCRIWTRSPRHDLHFGALELVLDARHIDAGDTVTRRVHELQARDVGRRCPDPRHDAHPLGHLDGLISDVHTLAAGPQTGCALDDGRPKAVPHQPIRQ